MKSRRKFRRLPVMGSVTIKFLKGGKVIEGFIANRSYSGLGAYVPKHVNTLAEIEVELLYYGYNNEAIKEKHQGQIVWGKNFGQTYAIGVKYTDLRPVYKKKITGG